jgi:tetratricopeptide (TPR) repeat protein
MKDISGFRWRLALGSFLLLGAFLAAGAIGQERTQQLGRLGKVEFKVECSAAAQQSFNRAMALYHSFAWAPAADLFANIAKTDPRCGMAHWGRAMVVLDNPFVWPGSLTPAKFNEVAAALDAARSAGLNSAREKDYVDALATFVRDHDKTEHRARLQALDQAMATLATRYPDDREAAILSALVTSANFDPTDKTYSNQLKAAKRLEPLFATQPDHPGVAHYMIHSYDYPPIAKHGLEAARRYAQIAPDAPHALHMPSHIFTRVGHWQESIESNRASAKAASKVAFDGDHATDYMVYAHLQLAQDRAAREAMEEALAKQAVDHFGAAFAYAAMPARLALEVGDWNAAAAAELKAPASAYPWQKYPQAEAVNAFARGVGAARAGDSAGASKEQVRLLALRDVAKERKLGYWAEQIDIQAQVVQGLTLVVNGKASEALEVLSEAAKREDATEKHVVTPGPLLPAREVLADILLETGKAAEAQIEYEAVLAKEPNRYRAMFGAGQAAHQAGNREKAKVHYAALVELGKSSDAQRKTLTEAREYHTGR